MQLSFACASMKRDAGKGAGDSITFDRRVCKDSDVAEQNILLLCYLVLCEHLSEQNRSEMEIQRFEHATMRV